MVDICVEVVYEGLGFSIVGDSGLFGGDEGALLRVFDCMDFVGEDLSVPSQGSCVHWGAWVNLDSHGLHSILHGEHQAGVEGDLSDVDSVGREPSF